MTYWSGEKLAERLGRDGLITPFDDTRIDCAAYQLRLGPEIYVSPASEAKDAKQVTISSLGENEAFTIPSGQFAFLMTEEIVTVPADAIAFISIRATVKFKGLVNVSGFHVDPGYSGRLIFSVFNAGPAQVHLKRGDECFLIWFASLDRTSERIKKDKGFTSIPTKMINPIAGEIHSFEGLLAKIKETEKKVQAVEKEHQMLKTTAAIAVTILLALAAKILWPAPEPLRSPSAVPEQAQPRQTQLPIEPPKALPSPADTKVEPAKK